MTVATEASTSVAVIVCAYTVDRYGDLVDCLDGLHRQTRPPEQIVCVVDGNDELHRLVAELVAQRGWRDVVVVANGCTPGLSGARNTGLAVSTSEIVAFIDDDAVPADSWLAEIVAPFAQPTVAAAGGRIEPGWPGERPTWFPPHLDWAVGCSIPTMPADGAEIRNMYGASAAFRRTALASVGGFPTELGRVGADAAGCEETDVCIRIRRNDPTATIVYAPRSEVVHRVTADRSTIGYVLRRCFAEGRSKAVLSARVGAGDATRDERAYALVISKVVLRDLVGGVVRPSRIGRAVVLTAGLVSASLGFLLERLRRRVRTVT